MNVPGPKTTLDGLGRARAARTGRFAPPRGVTPVGHVARRCSPRGPSTRSRSEVSTSLRRSLAHEHDDRVVAEALVVALRRLRYVGRARPTSVSVARGRLAARSASARAARAASSAVDGEHGARPARRRRPTHRCRASSPRSGPRPTVAAGGPAALVAAARPALWPEAAAAHVRVRRLLARSARCCRPGRWSASRLLVAAGGCGDRRRRRTPRIDELAGCLLGGSACRAAGQPRVERVDGAADRRRQRDRRCCSRRVSQSGGALALSYEQALAGWGTRRGTGRGWAGWSPMRLG